MIEMQLVLILRRKLLYIGDCIKHFRFFKYGFEKKLDTITVSNSNFKLMKVDYTYESELYTKSACKKYF